VGGRRWNAAHQRPALIAYRFLTLFERLIAYRFLTLFERYSAEWWCGMARRLRRGADVNAALDRIKRLKTAARTSYRHASVELTALEERGAASRCAEWWCGMPRQLRRGAEVNAALDRIKRLKTVAARTSYRHASVELTALEERGATSRCAEQWCGMARQLRRGAAVNAAR
jgi:hypothetical protein